MFKEEAKKRLTELQEQLPKKEEEVVQMKREIKGLEAYLNSVDGDGSQEKRGRKPKEAPAAPGEPKKAPEATKAQK